MNEISSNLMPTTSHYCTLSDVVSTIALVIALCRIFIVGTPPPFPLIKWGAGRTFQKLSHLEEGGVRNLLLERGDKPEKGWLM